MRYFFISEYFSVDLVESNVPMRLYDQEKVYPFSYVEHGG